MQNLLDFLYRFRTFGLFLLLEGICAWLIIRYNHRHNAAFLNSSNMLAASITEMSSNTRNYFQLQEINKQLFAENQKLREQLANATIEKTERDTLFDRYELIKAKVINNTYQRSLNFLTLDAGTASGIKPGMGVISHSGIVGQVKSASDHFTTVTSLLHRNLMVSSIIKNTRTLCTTQWDGVSPLQAELKYIPRHINIEVGDTVTTSGFNAVFPEGVMIGTISSYNLQEDDAFYEARVDLSTDFTSLHYVYIIDHELKHEKDSLETASVEIE